MLTKNCGENWSGASTGLNMKKKMELAWTWIKNKLWQPYRTSAAWLHWTQATEEEGGHGILGKETWRKKCGQQDTVRAGGRWMRQLKTELDGDKWSVAYVPRGVTRHRSSKSVIKCVIPILVFYSCYFMLFRSGDGIY